MSESCLKGFENIRKFCAGFPTRFQRRFLGSSPVSRLGLGAGQCELEMQALVHSSQDNENAGEIASPIVMHVPTNLRLRGAMWTNEPAQLLDGVGLVRPFQTVGGGACAMHAIFGVPDRSGRLHCADARIRMREAMESTYAQWRRDGQLEPYLGNVLQLVWLELAKTAALEERNLENPEPWLFLETPSARSAVSVTTAFWPAARE